MPQGNTGVHVVRTRIRGALRGWSARTRCGRVPQREARSPRGMELLDRGPQVATRDHKTDAEDGRSQ